MWLYFIASFAARINSVAIFWNERKDTVEKTFPAAPNPTVDGEFVRNENSLDTFFSISDYITTLAGVREGPSTVVRKHVSPRNTRTLVSTF